MTDKATLHKEIVNGLHAIGTAAGAVVRTTDDKGAARICNKIASNTKDLLDLLDLYASMQDFGPEDITQGQ